VITEEERQSIINEAVEKALLSLPEVIGSLLKNQAGLMKLSKELFTSHPEFKDSPDILASVIERVESDNPGIDYKKIIELSTPLIKEQMRIKKPLDMKNVSRPNRKLDSINFPSNLGEL
jgi:hypothetical protein